MSQEFNQDTTLSHYVASGTSSSARISVVASAAQTTGQFTPGQIIIPDYSNPTSTVKSANCIIQRPDNTVEHNTEHWTPTAAAAISSIQFLLASGSFVAGSMVRVYGLPAATGGASTGTGTRLRISANQSITTATVTPVNWDTEDSDADNQHYTSAANLTGTATKAAGSQAVVGVSTLFTTELSVGQVIMIPGTANEKAVVTAITDATHLTVAKPFVNAASGQTVARVNAAVAIRSPGSYAPQFSAFMAALASGTLTLQIKLNDTTVIAQTDPTPINAPAGYQVSLVSYPFQQWDFIEAIITQTSGGSVNLTADPRTSFEINSRPTIIVAVPYVLIQDRKAQNTEGGGFTSGADQSRVLNTVVSDSGGICSLTTNQFSLPAGTYRIHAIAPAYECDRHQAWLYNITDATTQKAPDGTTEIRSTSSVSGTADSVGMAAVIVGSFRTSGTKTFEIRHRCQTSKTVSGFGLAANLGQEIYTSVELWKEG
jgi:hypothetical protein